MKTITLHPVSVLVGLGLAGLALALTGAAQTPGAVRHLPDTQFRVVGEIPAEWWTYVRLSLPSQPYTVPSDKRFVVTAVQLPGSGDVLANGASVVPQLQAMSFGSDNHGTRVVFDSGAVLEVLASTVQFWGYLEPVR